MQIFLRISDLEAAVPIVVELLETDRLFGNDLWKAAMVGVSTAAAVDTKEFKVVFPANTSGVIRAR